MVPRMAVVENAMPVRSHLKKVAGIGCTLPDRNDFEVEALSVLA